MENKLKVLMINGSPRKDGNTSIALREMEKVFQENGVEVETVQVGNKAIRGCVACNSCAEKGKCVFDDVVNELAPKFEEADGLVIVDYKTDRAEAVLELVNKYQEQLWWYERALEQLTGKKVKEKLIYSFALHAEILLDMHK